MVNKKVDKKDEESSEEEEFESFVDEEPIATVSINKYDPYQLRDCTTDTIIAILEEKSFVEDAKYTDMKIVIGVIQVAITAAVHMYGYEDKEVMFDDKKPYIVINIVVYSLLMLAYYYIEWYVIKDLFFVTKKHEVSSKHNTCSDFIFFANLD